MTPRPGRLGVRFLHDLQLARLMAGEAVSQFIRNDDLRQASALAFATMLALLPALLLLTELLSRVIGSSPVAMQKVGDFVGEVIPKFGEVILREVGTLARHQSSVGLLNVLILFWAVTPLVANTRSIFNAIFRAIPRRSFWVSKALDFLMAVLFILGLAATAGSGLILRFLKDHALDLTPPPGLKLLLPFLVTTLLLLLMYAVFSPRSKVLHLLAGALTCAALWFLLRPAFSLFLLVHHDYGLAFGSFKSLFIIVIWIYYSQAVFLFGAEVIAALNRKEAVLILRLMEGRSGVPLLGRSRLVECIPKGTVIFQRGDGGREMFHILEGSVSIEREGQVLATLGPGAFFGEMSFLLGQTRSATALAGEDCECLVIREENLDALMREFPTIPRAMLTEMARRLRETNELPRG